ncbi:MAG: FtsW/RodA/SpoVE family cell cycle protein [Bdellovibrionales bacterium]
MRLDRGVLLSVFFLIGLGLVQVYSSSYIFATETYGDGLYFFRKQILFASFSLVALFVAYLIPWKYSFRLGVAVWILSVAGLVATFVPGLGVKAGGAARWILLPWGYRLEPAEFLRASYPFVLAPMMAQYSRGLMDRNWWLKIGVVLLPLVPLYLQPDFGTFVILIGLAACLFLAFGLRWRYIVASAVVVIPTLVLMVATSPYRRARVEAFLNPWSDPSQTGFQVIQSLLGFYSGGLTGVGLGQGQAKLFFLPEAHTDFTLAVLGEEMGFVGFFILLMVYGFLVFRGFQITLHLKRYRERAVALSFSLLLTFSVFINVGVALGLLPTKGLTLPLLSYGGSSLVATGLLVGWLLNLEREASYNLSFREKELE